MEKNGIENVLCTKCNKPCARETGSLCAACAMQELKRLSKNAAEKEPTTLRNAAEEPNELGW